MKNRINTRLLTGLAFLSLLPLNSKGQVSLTLDEVIRLCQDSAITAFQSQQEFQSQQASYEAFEALRKPQLSLKVLPNYSHYVSDPTRDYVYLRNYDIFSTAANLRLTQKVLPFGGEAYVGTQACCPSAVKPMLARRPFGVSTFARKPLDTHASSWPLRCW